MYMFTWTIYKTVVFGLIETHNLQYETKYKSFEKCN